MKYLLNGLLALAMTTSSLNLMAHHSFSATFTADRKSTIVGVVNNFSFRNPHVLIYIDVDNEDGTSTEWISEGAAATNMRRQGWSADTIKAGQLVRVSGDATHDGSPMTSIDYVEILDPETLAVVERLGEGAEGGQQQQRRQPAAPAPELAKTLDDGRPNLQAAWSNRTLRTTRPGQFETIELSATGQALQETFDISNDPQVFCDPVGLVRQVVTPHPIRITQFDDRVQFDYEEFGGQRIVYFDNRDAKGFHSHLGDSIAHYEGDTLVVTTTHLLPNQATNQGFRLSDQTQVVERYNRRDTEQHGSVLHLNMVISDPVNLASDIVHNVGYLNLGEYEFIENDCHAPLRERTDVHPAMNIFTMETGSMPSDQDATNALCVTQAANVGQATKAWQGYMGEPAVMSTIEQGSAQIWYNAKGQPVATNNAALINAVQNHSPLLVTERGAAFTAAEHQIYCVAAN